MVIIMYDSLYRKIPALMGILDLMSSVDSVLDVGCGFGKYGYLLREHLDIRKGNILPHQWSVKIDAVDKAENLSEIVQHSVYNEVYNRNIKDLLPELGRYDLILLADVIEYLEKDLARKLLSVLFESHCNKAMSISFAPNKAYKKYPEQVMPISQWKQDDFIGLFPNIRFRGAQVLFVFK